MRTPSVSGSSLCIWPSFLTSIASLYVTITQTALRATLTRKNRLNGREQLNQQRAVSGYVSSYSHGHSSGSAERKSKAYLHSARSRYGSQQDVPNEVEVRPIEAGSSRLIDMLMDLDAAGLAQFHRRRQGHPYAYDHQDCCHQGSVVGSAALKGGCELVSRVRCSRRICNNYPGPLICR